MLPAEPAVTATTGGGEAEHAPAALPLEVLQKPGVWGCFKFSLKQAGAGGSKWGGYEAICPYHKRNDKTGCK
eukprot:3458409-Amphidinium_carterae.1